MHDLKLEWAHRPKERHALDCVGEFELLRDALLEQLVETLAEALEFRCAGVSQIGETLRREAGNLMVGEGGIFRDRIADEKIVIPDDAYDIASPGFIYRLAVLGEESLGIAEADCFSQTRVGGNHVTAEAAGDDSNERNAVAVLGVHVGLDFEDKTREGFRVRVH